MSNKISQNILILNYLKQGNTLTPLEALNMFDCWRLGSVIHKLRKHGYQIKTKIWETPSGKHVAEYRLIEQS